MPQLKHKLTACLLLVLCLLPSLGSNASALSCPRDPDYPGAGTYELPNGMSSECERTSIYTFTGSGTNPTITYTKRSDSGNSTTVAVLTLVDASADPIVWRGNASYDGHPFEVFVSRSDFTGDSTGMQLGRSDNGQLTGLDRIAMNDIGRQFANSQNISVAGPAGPSPFDQNAGSPGNYRCGGGTNQVKTSINIGCRGEGNPIMDMIFAVIRFLSIGIGIVMVGSFIVAGYLYITSRGDPGQTANALKRIRENVIALLLYIFAYAILNYLIPSGVLN